MSKPTFTKEYFDIKHVLLDYYAESNKQGNSDLMKKAFTKNATMYFIDSTGRLAGGSVNESLYPVVDSFPKSSNSQIAIAYINITENVAQARVDSDNVNHSGFTDYFNLIKVNNQWKIISKIYYAHY
ncbi:MAG: nuclear transport factor 2 family protein [Limosilactobacillus sp.]|uniref:nuclear transport factor 2 family protein n=1 Tax=Limosilactobacillus sp. TaxID=2773925 RepID=UPI0023C3B89B|nr:nuclear transport factor 2 family protein [Limosilactobacillus sp.]MDE7039475.1 nuclear transport factor 2 family protein [Limosilactobacillus sp.]